MTPARRVVGLALAAGVVYLAVRTARTASLGLPLPKGSWRLSSDFGLRDHPITGAPSHHTGVDLAAPLGTPVYAVDGGEVVSTTDHDPVDGVSVGIRSGGKTWYYLHLSERYVSRGDRVKRGDNIGRVGSTGRSTGPHLHLQVENRHGEPIDPLKLIPRLA